MYLEQTSFGTLRRRMDGKFKNQDDEIKWRKKGLAVNNHFAVIDAYTSDRSLNCRFVIQLFYLNLIKSYDYC